MYIYKNKLVFIAHPRMASRSISDALIEGGATKWMLEHHQIDEIKIEQVLSEGGLVACVHRNMFDVLVSWFYRSRTQTFVDGYTEEVPVEEFGKWLHTILKEGHQYLDVPVYHYGMEHANYPIPFGLLGPVTPLLMRRVGLKAADIKHRGRSNRAGDYEYFYTSQTRKLVEDRWAEDLKLTAYDFGD